MSTIIFDAAVDFLLNDPQGPMGRDLAERLIRCTSAAKLNASGRPGPRVRTGRLRSSIRWVVDRDQEGLYGDYGTDVNHGRFLELGLLRNGARYPFLLPALPAAQG